MTGAELLAARAALGLTQGGLATLLECGRRTVQHWESDEREIPGPVKVIAEALLKSQPVRNYFGVALKGDLIDSL